MPRLILVYCMHMLHKTSVKCCFMCVCVFWLGKVVWKCEVSEAIIPERCNFEVKDNKMVVTLKKQKPGLWSSFRAHKVSTCS